MRDFLVQHAKFPSPQLDEGRAVITTDIISPFEVALLPEDWKANHAVRDNTLVLNLCNALDSILGDAPLAADDKNKLLAGFSPRVQLGDFDQEDPKWEANPSEAHARRLLDSGVLRALGSCMWLCGRYRLRLNIEQVAGRGTSKVDYVVNVDGKDEALVEAKSPSVMKKVGELLPPRGIELTWARRQSLVPTILAKASMILSSLTTFVLKKSM